MHDSDSEEMSFRGLAPDDRNGFGAGEPAAAAPRTEQPGALAPRLDGASVPVEPEPPLRRIRSLALFWTICPSHSWS